MRRLVLCFDGSWNRIDAPYPTNVLFTAECVLPEAKGVAQLIFYDEGVGTEEGEELKGGVFGGGLVKNLADGYRFLMFNHMPRDEIYIFGFSRGAFTARSFAGLISNCGILRRRDAGRVNEAIEMYRRRTKGDHSKNVLARFRSEFSPHLCVSKEDDQWRSANVEGYASESAPVIGIQYLGVWDTVGALGIPRYLALAAQINRKHQFHDTNLSSFVRHARHAVAIDERRRDFEPTIWDNLEELNRARGADPASEDAPYQQQWFPGVHGAVGGGGDLRGLSDQTLDWIWDGARNAGLVLDSSPSSRVYELAPSHTSPLQSASEKQGFDLTAFGMKKLMPKADRVGPRHLYEVSVSARRRWHENAEKLPEGTAYCPKTLEGVADGLANLDKKALGVGEDPTVNDPNKFKVYNVVRGDTLRGIAHRHLGKASLSNRIFEANKFKISDPDRIYVGQVLRIPVEPQ